MGLTMTKALFDFKCEECGYVHERYIYADVKTSECPNCGCIAEKTLSAPAKLRIDGMPSDLMSDAWAKRREKHYQRKRDNGDT